MSVAIDLNSYAQADFKPGAKRRKIANDIVNKEKFAAGAIMRVKVKNFVVYASTEFLLSPSLNMIIAPNGTGKSTFVCAVCLGLAGHPSLLGRQKVVSEFVKNGEQSSTIEITLKNKDGADDVVIRRDIYLSNKSDWYINGRTSTEPKVKALLLQLNVQLDNLCQFLPQEKVADFSKLTQEQLLLETQRAVDVNMMNQHKELIALDEKKISHTAVLKEKCKLRAEKDEDRLRFEEEARKYEAFQKKKSELEDHKMLLPYAEIQDLKRESEQLKLDRDRIKQELENYNDEVRPFKDAVEEIEADVTMYLNAIEDKSNEVNTVAAELKDRQEKVEADDERIRKLKDAIESVETKALKRREERATIQQKVADEEVRRDKIELIDQDTMKEYVDNADRLHLEVGEYQDRISAINDQIGSKKRFATRVEEEAKRLSGQLSSNDRISIFNSGGLQNNKTASQSKSAVLLLRGEFKDMRSEILEPPILAITTTHPEYAPYLEELVDLNTTFALTAISKQAFDRHSRRFLEEKRVNVPFRYLGNSDSPSKMSSEQLRSYGFEGYMRDFVQGPAPIVQMLSEGSFIHDVPVSRRPLSDQQIERLRSPDHTGQLLFKKFFSGDTMYTLSQSRYGSRQIIMRTQPVMGRRGFFSGAGLTDEAKRNLQQSIQEKKRELEVFEEEINELRNQRQQREAELDNINQQFGHFKKLARDAQAKVTEVRKINARIDNYVSHIAKIDVVLAKDHSADIILNQKRLKKVAVDRINTICEIAELQNKYNDHMQELTLLKIKHFEQEARAVSVKGLFSAIEEKRKELESKLTEAKKRIQELKNNSRRRELHEIASSYPEKTRERLAGYVSQYMEENRFSYEIVVEMIGGIEAELQLLGSGSKSSVSTLEKINEVLATLNDEIPKLEMEVKSVDKQMRDVFSEWEPKLSAMVGKISEKFSSIFPTVGSAGEVRVARRERFAEWKMEIMVKFRDGSELKALDSHSQSGGERAVSTIYYMISMQELTVSPFRVVDEINQGMDARNERTVHKHMVEIACQEHTSQYFLITPKLLTNLHYAENMRIHCIMAGPWTPDPRTKADFLTLGATSLYDV